MSDEGDSVLTSYKSNTDTTPAPDDKVVTAGIRPTAQSNPKARAVTRDPIDPRPVGMVLIYFDGRGVDSGMGMNIPEHTEVLDCHTMTRMSVGRVASRYEFGANLNVSHDGHTWRVETWRERAMRLEEWQKRAMMMCDTGG